MIAHRLSTIKDADLIVGIERGEVIEHGNYDELMTQKGLYYTLVTAQTEKEHKIEERSDMQDDDDDDNKKDTVSEQNFGLLISYKYLIKI